MASVAKTNSFGIDKEIWQAISAKFDPVKAKACMDWIEAITGETAPAQTDSVIVWFSEALKDGFLLSKLMLTLDPDVKNRIKKKKWKAKRARMPFQAMEQIELFGKACKELGMRETDVATSQDVYNMENPNAVVTTLYALNAIVKNNGFGGPFIAGSYDHSHENKRHFTEAQLRKSKAAVPSWNEGSIQHESDGRLDSAGIVKTAGSEDHKISHELSKWEKGSIKVEGENNLDKIIKTAGNEHWKISNEQSQQMAGTIAYEEKGLDSYGIVLGGDQGTN